jgi:hypothetical protein
MATWQNFFQRCSPMNTLASRNWQIRDNGTGSAACGRHITKEIKGMLF